MVWPKEDKELSGLARSPTMDSLRGSLRSVRLSRDNSNEEKEGFFTGRSWSGSDASNPFDQRGTASDPIILSSPAVPPPSPTSLRTTQPSPTPGSNWDPNPCDVTPLPTGVQCLPTLSLADSMTSLPILQYVIIAPSELYALTIQSQWASSELLWCIGDAPVLVSRAAHGMKPVWMLTLRIPAQNSGTATVYKKMWYLMNFEVQSMCLMYSDGLTGIRCVWRSKAPASPYLLEDFGSRAISTRLNGGQDSMLQH